MARHHTETGVLTGGARCEAVDARRVVDAGESAVAAGERGARCCLRVVVPAQRARRGVREAQREQLIARRG